MKKMVELLGEERGPQDIEEVCFGKIKISKFVQSFIFIYISSSGKSCIRFGASHFCDGNLTNCVNITRSYIYFHLMVFVFIPPETGQFGFFLGGWKQRRNIYETETISANLSENCRHFCHWSCISDDAFNAFAAKMFFHRIYFVNL